jgi:hypothetical protein
MRQLIYTAAVCICSIAHAQSSQIRVATFNVEDVRSSDLVRENQPRIKMVAEVIQRMRPNVILINEIAYDHPGVDGIPEDFEPGQNALRFVENYVNRVSFEGTEPIRYKAYMWPSNTGMHSGFDLDNDGEVTNSYDQPPASDAEGRPSPQTKLGRAFGGDAWGFGTFPGQYAMAILVDERLTVLEEDVRTFRLMPWDYLAASFAPADPDSGEAWYSDDEWAKFRLSSKSHWDVPVKLPNGAVVHMLCSHPTPPAFDGPEERNKRRNHDELRFWGDYLSQRGYIVDDSGSFGGLPRGEHFVILGDLNADPKDPAWEHNAIQDRILLHPRVGKDPKPVSEIVLEGLDPTDTATWGKRADYVLPSKRLVLLRSGIWRPMSHSGSAFPSDHFPVWAEIKVPAP